MIVYFIKGAHSSKLILISACFEASLTSIFCVINKIAVLLSVANCVQTSCAYMPRKGVCLSVQVHVYVVPACAWVLCNILQAP